MTQLNDIQTTAWIEAGLQCHGVELGEWEREAIVRYGEIYSSMMFETYMKVSLNKNYLEYCLERMKSEMHDLRLENSGQAALIEKLKDQIQCK